PAQAPAAPAAAPARAPAAPAAAPAQAPAAPAEPAAAQAEAAANVAAVEQAAEPEPAELPWALRHRRFSARSGSTGGLRVVEPGSGEPGALRLQVMLDTAPADDFLLEGESIGQGGQALSVSWTALPALEVFGALRGTTTAPDELGPAPTSLQVQGGHLGFKVFTADLRPLHIGGELAAQLRNDMGGQTPLLEATNVSIRGAMSLDLRDTSGQLPLITRLNLEYLFDNSAAAVEAVEDARYDLLEGARPRVDEDRHLISRAERYALGVDRVDSFNIGLGFELPLEAGQDTYLHPLLEWQVGVPVNRQDFTCPLRTDEDAAGTSESEVDGCVGQSGFESWPMNLTAGVRVVPPIRGVTLALALDVGLSGTDSFVHELSPNTPFALMFALGYDYDARPAAHTEVIPLPPPEPAPAGRVRGLVTDAVSGAPIPSATISLGERGIGGLASGAEGTFVSHELSPGPVTLTVAHPDYRPGQCVATIPEAGGDADVRCTLNALPQEGGLRGVVTDSYGVPVAGARVQLSGPTAIGANTDGEGAFAFAGLPPGQYNARIDSSGHFLRLTAASVEARDTATLQASLIPRPTQPGVTVKAGRIRAPGLRFEAGSTTLDSSAAMALAELADTLLRQPSLRRIKIVGGGDPQTSLARALEIRRRLVEAGVPEADLEAVGERSPKVKLSIMQ
ncbi:MAG: carboxypeptidase regulatory-like domain-containing protein, partial [Myxococcales bacterium]|nr:carboxypeptidase regulatory-like domain-containing protein [Myxococcales bacterium]